MVLNMYAGSVISLIRASRADVREAEQRADICKGFYVAREAVPVSVSVHTRHKERFFDIQEGVYVQSLHEIALNCASLNGSRMQELLGQLEKGSGDVLQFHAPNGQMPERAYPIRFDDINLALVVLDTVGDKSEAQIIFKTFLEGQKKVYDEKAKEWENY